ncbi:ParB/RepB/Spo0J family partition protein [Roseimicrobium gellanilyticum]|nr:ParB N-terminal domain-containing protein [Roseimicrobium gellanilyticum]
MKFSSSNIDEAVSGSEYKNISPAALIPHPFNAQLYGKTDADQGLEESVREHGIRTPIIIDSKNTIISGHRRHAAAVACGLESVPVIVIARTLTENEAHERILDGNQYRTKTTEQKLREYREYRRIESEKAKLRQSTNGPEGVKKFAPAEKGKARDIAAKKVDLSGVTAAMGLKVLDKADELRRDGAIDEADELLRILNEESIHAAGEVLKTKGLQPLRARTQVSDVEDEAEGPAQTDVSGEVEDEQGEPELPHFRMQGTARKQITTGKGLNLAELGSALKAVFDAPKPAPAPYIASSSQSEAVEEDRGTEDEVIPAPPLVEEDGEPEELARRKWDAKDLDQAIDLLDNITDGLRSLDTFPAERIQEWKEFGDYFFRTLKSLGVEIDI